MKQDQQTKFFLLFEAAKRSLLMTEILFKRIKDSALTFEPLIDKNIQIGDKAAIPLMDCVAFIDFADRFGEVVDQLPMINKKSNEMRKIKSVLLDVGIVRNHLQHLRGDLSSNHPIRFPVLGYFSWTNSTTSYSIAMTQPIEQDFYTISYDLVERKWVGNFQYSLMGKNIDLDIVLSEMKKVYTYITSIIDFSDPSVPELNWGDTQSIGVKIILDEK